MSEREMFEKSFKRPSNYFSLSQDQWDIDKYLGILDWKGGGDITKEDKERFDKHYKR
jgi:hypothetical protein